MPTHTIVAVALLLISLVILGFLTKIKAIGPIGSACAVCGGVASVSAMLLFA